MRKGKLLIFEPRPASSVQAWCYTCRGLRSYQRPLPPLTHPTPSVTLLEGVCATCGGVLWRVGGGRAAEGHEQATPDEDRGVSAEQDSPGFAF
jgi:hypothetical protein